MNDTEALATLTSLSTELSALAAHLRAGVARIETGGRGIGSGVAWSVREAEDGGEPVVTVVTNAHVVGAARGTAPEVSFAGGHTMAAAVRAIDPRLDLAALEVRGQGVTPLEIGDSSRLRVGELVVAVGNPFGRSGAVTIGVVAARAPADPDVTLQPAEADADGDAAEDARRPRVSVPRRMGWPPRRLELIQADVRLYPGNSGGPLADTRGRVVGINAMIGGGLAFAIPSRAVQHFLADAGRAPERAYLGVQVVTVPLPDALRTRLGLAQPRAPMVVAVETDSPAEAAGVIVGDVIVGVDGVALVDAWQLPSAIRGSAARSGQPLALTLMRAGDLLALALVPERRAA